MGYKSKVRNTTPGHDLGFYWEQLEQIFTSVELEEFKRWMSGQTVGLSEDNRAVYYVYDVARFARGDRMIWD